MRPLSRLVKYVLFAVIVAAPAAAIAAPPAPTRPAPQGDAKDSSTIYVFPDDPLGAGALGPNDAIIKGGRSIFSVMLIRPRYHFVQEMLRSVEHI